MVVASIIIPTYRRPDTLVRAVRSCFVRGEEPYEVIVVDNNPDGSARGSVNALAAEAALPVRYVAEPRPGISHARNTALAAAQGRYLAFLDDDQEAMPGWLASHLETLRRFDADISFGPIHPEFPADAGPLPPFVQRRYTRDENMPSGSRMPARSPLLGSPGISNTVIDRERCLREAAPFDLAYGFAGGEDTLLFREFLRQGRKMVWCAEAAVHETIPAARLTTRYLLRRAFNGGQVSASTWGALKPPDRGRMLAVMAAGLVQASLYALPALVCRACNNGRWPAYAAQVAAGLGKVFCSSRGLMPLYREDRRDPTRTDALDGRQARARS